MLLLYFGGNFGKKMMQSIKNILVSTDFSKPGNNAIKTAIQLCKQHSAVLHLLYVVDNRHILPASEAGPAASAIVDEMDQKARILLYSEYEAILRDHKIQVRIHMPTGIPPDEICKAADEMPVDLIVMGTHGASGVREFYMGTTAYGVIKHATKPVLTIPANFEALEFKKILLPLKPVLGIREKFEFLRSFLNTRQAALHVATLCSPNESAGYLVNNGEKLQEVLALLKKTTATCTKALYVCKNYAAKVLELSESLAVDLVVINATLDYKWIQFIAGPYTRQVVNHAKVPVLSFRHGNNILGEN